MRLQQNPLPPFPRNNHQHTRLVSVRLSTPPPPATTHPQGPAQLYWVMCANEEMARFMILADALLADKDKVRVGVCALGARARGGVKQVRHSAA